jgi:hypothetical protein
MDTATIRHINFMALYKAFRDERSHLPERGMLKLFAEEVEISDRYLSHLKHNRKNIGAAIARQIEDRLHLSHGWMDNRHDQPATTQPADELEANFLSTAQALYRSAPAEARAMMLEFLKRKLEPEPVANEPKRRRR